MKIGLNEEENKEIERCEDTINLVIMDTATRIKHCRKNKEEEAKRKRRREVE